MAHKPQINKQTNKMENRANTDREYKIANPLVLDPNLRKFVIKRSLV